MQKLKSKKKLKLKGLDTLRAIAAIIVVLGHIELLKNEFQIQAKKWHTLNGDFAVTLFFVISGFLITYLIVKEKQKYGDFSFKKFYIRRMLRIWPLYYLTLFLSYFFFSDQSASVRSIFLHLLTFSNVPFALNEAWKGSPQVWSIGVEEQFYLFWPLFLYLLPSKKINFYILTFIFLYVIFLPHGLNFINSLSLKNEKLHTFSLIFFTKTKFQCMAWGGFLGYNLALDKKWLSFFYEKKWVVLALIFLSFGIWFLGLRFYLISHEIYAFLFGLMIIGLAKNPFFNIDNFITSFLGKISYGIYMYHFMVTIFLIKILPENLTFYNPILYALTLILTILISWISYETFEKFFLNLKKKFEV